ncbi:carnitine dehydratase [Berryella intestinalis]|uniref:Carnitine dehydratase n=1 Tax=Berryella intestinalis TaxID=1531429 RepID=A0A0A8B4K1_9ACTN|nr:CoA transferase [Berryella intestinalis]AJC12426.1 carnitine dehydratase [Berryella intestinalis]
MLTTEALNGYGPLNGVKVVELCEWVAAPAAVRILSEMGAQIMKVEPIWGDAQRTQGPGFGCEQTEVEDPTIDLNNTNKNWISLNLKDPEALEVMHKLLAEADVFINNWRDKALVKMGLDYASLKEKYPRLIWAQMRGYGEYGPEKDTPGFDAVCWAARGGVANVFREDGQSPAIPPQAFGDYNAASIMAGGITAALFNRTRTNKGDKVVCNLYGAAIWGGNIGVMATQFGAPYPKSRTRVPNPFNNTYRTKDEKWMLICMPQYDKYYNMMMEITGLNEHIDQPDTCNLPALKASGKQPEVIGWLSDAFVTKTFEEWDEILREHEVPHQKCFRYTDIIKDEEAYDNDSLRWVEYDAFGKKALPMSPLRFDSAGDPPIVLSKPVGYHTAEIMSGLGYTDEQIKTMDESGAVKVWHGEECPDVIFRSKRQEAGEAPCNW